MFSKWLNIGVIHHLLSWLKCHFYNTLSFCRCSSICWALYSDLLTSLPILESVWHFLKYWISLYTLISVRGSFILPNSRRLLRLKQSFSFLPAMALVSALSPLLAVWPVSFKTRIYVFTYVFTDLKTQACPGTQQQRADTRADGQPDYMKAIIYWTSSIYSAS